MGRKKGLRSYRNNTANRQGEFDPFDEKYVKHTKIGVWDYYEEADPRLSPIPGSSWIQACYDIFHGMPYLWRMVQDILSIPTCKILLPLYFALQWLNAMLPGLALWYSAQMLQIVQTAIDERKVDTTHLMHISLGHLGCAFLTRLLALCILKVRVPIDFRIKQHYSVHIFEAMARLDVPTFDDKGVQRQLEQSHSNGSSSAPSVAAETLQVISHIFNTIVQVGCQTSVLYGVLRNQRDGGLLTALTVSGLLLQWVESSKQNKPGRVWAATTSDETFIRMSGMKVTVAAPEHHKEIVAGGLQEYLLSQYKEGVVKIGSRATDFMEVMMRRKKTSLLNFLYDPLRQLPKIIIVFRAAQSPATVPISLASLNLITETTHAFTRQIRDLLESTNSVAYHIDRVYGFYQITKIPNRVEDGTTPFPENTQSLLLGISIEFREVSFAYPGSESYALRNVSFKIEQGQLCVIVGANGSGKSTILKLLARIYDPTEGEILFNGLDIRSYRLRDLRRAISVLFQDFTIFPLSIKDNIGLGDPDNATDTDRIRQAARLGGAEEFIDRLPEGFDTYLERPVNDLSSGLPSGTKTIFGKPVEHGRILSGMDAYGLSLSGGQMQRIALARNFMRSHMSESTVGLLLFDEPSASLDPATEHDLFQRLRQLRGNKTMIFSSHRFGNLTRHADLILFMHNAVIVETGSHDELLKSNGEYARLWRLQAEAFLP